MRLFTSYSPTIHDKKLLTIIIDTYTIIFCVSFRKEYESLDLGSLTIIDSNRLREDVKEDNSAKPFLLGLDDSVACDVCRVSDKYEKAVAYCVDCEVKACDLHITEVSVEYMHI